MTPSRIAQAIGRSPKVVRSYCRDTFPHERYQRWKLDEEQVLAVCLRFLR